MTDSNSIQLRLMKGSQLVVDLLPNSAKPEKLKILVKKQEAKQPTLEE